MQKNSLIAIIGIFSLFFFTFSIADTTPIPANSMQMDTILKKLNDKGFKVIRKVEYNDGSYTAEIINTMGEKEKIQINAKSGDLVEPPKSTTKSLTLMDVWKKVNDAGYKHIYKIKSDGGSYEVNAFDKDGKSVDLKVNAAGEISKDWF